MKEQVSSNKNNGKLITICYGTKKEWSSQSDAICFFLECYCLSSGNEKNRYFKILNDIISGKKICTDEN